MICIHIISSLKLTCVTVFPEIELLHLMEAKPQAKE